MARKKHAGRKRKGGKHSLKLVGGMKHLGSHKHGGKHKA
jgi:hypothetical protein